MKVTENVQELRKAVGDLKAYGIRLGFVPTMGALHEGHLSLVRRAARENDRVVVSIYVNPAQFGPEEDLDRYPRDLEGDLEKLRQTGADLVFLPGDETMYPAGFATWVDLPDLSESLCGASRPGHFRGVATVVARLLNMVQPDRMYLGQKDGQQAVILRKMVQDLAFPVEVVVCPTIREEDGLAMSSRNRYLSPGERASALVLNRSLGKAREWFAAGVTDPEEILSRLREEISSTPHMKLIYLELADPQTLKPVERIRPGTMLAVAALAGNTRLIDNIVLEEDPC